MDQKPKTPDEQAKILSDITPITKEEQAKAMHDYFEKSLDEFWTFIIEEADKSPDDDFCLGDISLRDIKKVLSVYSLYLKGKEEGLI